MWNDLAHGWRTNATTLWRRLSRAWLACLWAVVAPFVMCITLWPDLAVADTAHAFALAPLSGPRPAVAVPQGQVTVLDQASLLPDTSQGVPPPPDARWQAVQLPHIWSRTHPGYAGSMWYRLQINLPAEPNGSWAVYLPRVIMNGQVWVNGVALGYTGSMTEPVTRNWYVPLMFTVPANLWKQGENTLLVRVVSGYESNNGLAPIEVGPVELVVKAYNWRHLAQVDGPKIIQVALITMGVLMLTIWVRDRSQSAFGYMGLAAVLWSLASALNVAQEPFTSAPVWEILCNTVTNWFQLALAAFFFRFAEIRFRALYWGFAAVAVVLPIYYTFWPSIWGLGILVLGIYISALIGMACTIWHVVRHGRPDGWWLIAACALVVPCGGHDVMILLGFIPYGAIYWLAFPAPLIIGFTFVILAGDSARSRGALAELNRSLGFLVAERESALRESFQRVATLERTQAVTAERGRILRDMHDGVGAHLTSALRQLQSPRPSGVDLGLVTQTLRDSLDQLKLSVDALSLQQGDVLGLLASLRFRIAPRLKAAGLELIWDVADLPEWPDGQAPALRQLQYILFEGLSNVLQHSGATRLVLSARAFEDHIQVSLIDNGRGWGGQGEGQGLQAMRARASVIGAMVEFRTAPEGGAELRLMLPLRHEGASTLSSAA
jgi:signal transduction histidine kinase